jgi:hypothetical protein
VGYLQADNGNYSDSLKFINQSESKPDSLTLNEYSIRLARQNADLRGSVGDFSIGFFKGMSFPIFSTLYMGYSDLGLYPAKIPLKTNPEMYRLTYYSEINKKRKVALVTSTLLGGTVPIVLIFVVSRAINKD